MVKNLKHPFQIILFITHPDIGYHVAKTGHRCLLYITCNKNIKHPYQPWVNSHAGDRYFTQLLRAILLPEQILDLPVSTNIVTRIIYQ